MVAVSPGIDQTLDPCDWRRHRFGLAEERWRSLAGGAFWITGAGTGYGHALSAALAAAGADVFLSGRRRSVLERSIAAIAELGIGPQRCHALPVDITDPVQLSAAAGIIASRVPALFGLVNNAAVPQPAGEWPLSGGELAAWSKLIDTNVTGNWLATRAALPLLSGGRSMRVLFMSSEAGWASTPGFGPYNVCKAALNSLGLSCAAELAARFPDHDVQINVLVPGEARTEMNQASGDSAFMAVPMALALLSHPPGGPNGRLFHRDGRHLAFGYAESWSSPVTDAVSPPLRPASAQAAAASARASATGWRSLSRLLKRFR